MEKISTLCPDFKKSHCPGQGLIRRPSAVKANAVSRQYKIHQAYTLWLSILLLPLPCPAPPPPCQISPFILKRTKRVTGYETYGVLMNMWVIFILGANCHGRLKALLPWRGHAIRRLCSSNVWLSSRAISSDLVRPEKSYESVQTTWQKDERHETLKL